MKYIRYRRKSSEQDERQALSIGSQKTELERKFPELKIIQDIEESKSAFLPEHRPGFALMIKHIKEGKADGIIAYHPDRLSRNEIDAATITYLLRQGIIKDLKFSSYFFDNSPEGIMMLQSALSHSQYSSSKLSVDVKRGLRTKAEEGWLPSGAKPGYMNDKFAEKGNKTILVDPERFRAIRKCWDMMLTGTYTVPHILEVLNNDYGYRTPIHKRSGGKPMMRSMLYKTFNDPFYYGEFEYPVGSGNWHQGKHEPMITKAEFNKVQHLLGKKGHRKPHTIEFDYTGLMNCGECDAVITAEEKWQLICPACKTKFASKNKNACTKCGIPIEEMVNPTLLHYVYYHCTKRKNPNCSQGSIRLEELETQIDKLLSQIEISDAFKDWAIKHINELNDKETIDRNAALKGLQQAYNDCVKRMTNLLDMKISPQNSNGSLLSDEEYMQRKSELMNEKTLLEEKMGDTGERIKKWMEVAEKSFEFASHARHWFANGDRQTKREILNSLGSNLTLQDKVVRVTLEKPLQYIQQAINETETISKMFEPTKKPDIEAQIGVNFSQNPTLLRD